MKKEEAPVIPPLSSPLSQPFIGYGVINVSYTRVMDNPEPENAVQAEGEGKTSSGYLRRGAVVRIHERKLIINNAAAESWLLVEESCKGWLRESLVDVYENEFQARTASNSMLK